MDRKKKRERLREICRTNNGEVKNRRKHENGLANYRGDKENNTRSASWSGGGDLDEPGTKRTWLRRCGPGDDGGLNDNFISQDALLDADGKHRHKQTCTPLHVNTLCIS